MRKQLFPLCILFFFYFCSDDKKEPCNEFPERPELRFNFNANLNSDKVSVFYLQNNQEVPYPETIAFKTYYSIAFLDYSDQWIVKTPTSNYQLTINKEVKSLECGEKTTFSVSVNTKELCNNCDYNTVYTLD